MGVKWLAKALLQSTISFFPNNEKINYFFQTKISKTIPASKDTIVTRVSVAARHYDVYKKFSDETIENPVFYEFGAGWDLKVPIFYYMLGVNNQLVIDIENHVRFGPLNHVIDTIRNNMDQVTGNAGRSLRALPTDLQINSNGDMENNLGIKYLAPCDGRNTGFENDSVDFISTTWVIQSIPPEDLFKIMVECYRILKKGSVASFFVDCNDQYSYVDSGISRYNFLKYTESQWKYFNSDVHYQNRLRVPEYVEIFERANFEIVEMHKRMPDEKTKNILKTMKIDNRFKKYSIDDLSVTSFWVTLRK